MLAHDVRDYLAVDGELMAMLTGGIYDGLEITRQDMPAAFDINNEVRPCALVRGGVQNPNGPHPDGSQAYLDVFIYQRAGYDVIELARERIYVLLHRQRIVNGMWEMRSANESPNLTDQALRCSLAISSYVTYVNRRP